MSDFIDVSKFWIISPESAEILWKAYTDWLQMTYDFYMDVIGIWILFIVVFCFIYSVFIPKSSW